MCKFVESFIELINLYLQLIWSVYIHLGDVTKP